MLASSYSDRLIVLQAIISGLSDPFFLNNFFISVVPLKQLLILHGKNLRKLSLGPIFVECLLICGYGSASHCLHDLVCVPKIEFLL
jgi:hypothetical protein